MARYIIGLFFVCLSLACLPDHNAEPQKATPTEGCVGLGFSLGMGSSACLYSDASRSDFPWDSVCTTGWTECHNKPAQCDNLPGFFVGVRGWSIWMGADNSGGCGAPPPGSSVVGYGCGRSAPTDQKIACNGGYSNVSANPWRDSIGVLCCKLPYFAWGF